MGRLIPKHWFHADRFPWVCHPAEQKPVSYTHLGVFLAAAMARADADRFPQGVNQGTAPQVLETLVYGACRELRELFE